jgi:hypothetical protein
MDFVDRTLVLSAGDLTGHLTELERAVAERRLSAPARDEMAGVEASW